MRRSLLLVVLAVVAILAAACAPAATPGSDLTGKTWLLTGITEQVPAFQGVVPPDQQGKYTITFATDGTFQSQADCNQVGGTYKVSGTSKITIEPGPSTLAFCPDGDLGVLFTTALGTATSYAISGSDLTLTADNGGTLQFTAGTAASPDAAITPAPAGAVDPTAVVGPTWRLVALTEKVPAFQGVVPPAEQSKYTITFADDGTFSAQVDCNQLAGSYTAGADGSMSIIPGPMTMAMCPEGSLDGLYLVALGNVTGWAVDGGTMNLTLTDGGTLEFAAAE
jgi:heat shock protein HslJ